MFLDLQAREASEQFAGLMKKYLDEIVQRELTSVRVDITQHRTWEDLGDLVQDFLRCVSVHLILILKK